MARSDYTLERAVHAALVYADLFDYPLRVDEVHRFLPGYRASQGEVASVLVRWPAQRGFYHLAGRDHVVDCRLSREAAASRLWQHARSVGLLFWALPFVRMVGVTGSLAMNNVARDDDIDFMLVTHPDRLWTARALAIGVVRLARLRGCTACPNYLVSTRALALRQHNLFTAHELLQLVPLHGRAAYHQLLDANAWVWSFLPNAQPKVPAGEPAALLRARGVAERLLRDGVGTRFETWESRRKIRRFTAEAGPDQELGFSVDECKGHFDRHGSSTLAAYAGRLSSVEALSP
ncbi:MAG: hypothetical protein JO023_20745 [Chloroflexi bacterium]|nr:hypothetical protein [Chloroflexota bacterium]